MATVMAGTAAIIAVAPGCGATIIASAAAGKRGLRDQDGLIRSS
jgi:hypothetical protein